MVFEFFAIVHDASSDKQALPKKFSEFMEDCKPRELKLREVGNRRTTTWDMDVSFDRTGRMFLTRGWECFAQTYGLQDYYFLICSYDGRDVLTVKMFDLSMCRVQYNETYKGSVKMELSDFEFYMVLEDAPSDKLGLPRKFADLLKDRQPRKLKLLEVDDPSRSPWVIDVLFDASGLIFLQRGWEQFAKFHCLHQGSFLLFSFDGFVLLTVKVFNMDMCRRHYLHRDDANTSNHNDTYPRADEESMNDDSTDEDDPFESSIIVSQRVVLDDHEKDHIRELLPPKDEYIGVPYVTRLTRTNLARYEMKLPQSVADSADIPSSGHAGLCVGASEAVTTVPYNTDSDGRIMFGRNSWRKFLEGRNLQEMQAVLLTLRSTRHSHLEVMIVMQMV